MIYHNTLPEHGSNLIAYTDTAERQDKEVYSIFVKYSKHPIFCNSDINVEFVWQKFFEHKQVPLTSIRRAFSNLQSQGLIEKSGEKVMGMYGRKINLWKLTK